MCFARILTAAIILVFFCTPASAQPFTKDVDRIAPYKNYKFRVRWDAEYVPGIFKVSPLHRKTQVIRGRKGGEPSVDNVSPGTTNYEPIVLVRGRTHDKSFEQWANKVHNVGAEFGKEQSLEDYRKPITIEVMNEAGQVALRFNAFRCWPSEYMPISELNARAPETLVEKLVLQCEGFQRDYNVTEPDPPSFTKPDSEE
ncbi:phage tail protein [Salinibacter ruber]|uniref:Phage tail-like protein n=1 Tax=Salinibacter ruber TaxID=146919 RepID=A0A9X2U6H4_9BACT|nr:phage tail protein [Salinibacter ruber]MCS3655979.1 phage tail-like protein [Salinibacter ruber]MCS3950745.1 phage tail-like protein [Salinibacter ruber]MCS4117508.1 phage tail-like protein [Salinibacter ruber]MCS4153375.1 phage tail-like protein [Salinibacter ruber]MCS4169334.1 phage tail-like protein [Salinibacter ruber]